MRKGYGYRMTERESHNIAVMKQKIFMRDGYTCQNCGGSIYAYSFPQLAHCIAATVSNIRKYGKEVINHPDNMKSVCCLTCNDAMNIGFSTMQANELANKINESIENAITN